MKHVVAKLTPANQILPCDVSEVHYFGTVIGKVKGFISRVDAHGRFRVFSIKQLTIGNHWDTFDSLTLRLMIEKLLENNYLIIQFDTPEELFTWLAYKPNNS